ncbi:hypothetical protein A9P79_29920 (plasmid) [Cupriavidus taiwanensis]|nr:hypothetical protein A9P79_29920 [Cupriavidus taiwanensis]
MSHRGIGFGKISSLIEEEYTLDSILHDATVLSLAFLKKQCRCTKLIGHVIDSHGETPELVARFHLASRIKISTRNLIDHLFEAIDGAADHALQEEEASSVKHC